MTDLEAPPLTRRAFLGSLAALLALPPSLARSADPPSLPVRGLNHMTLMVSDVARSTAFYQGLFGMPVQARQGPTPCLRIGTGPAFMALTQAPPGAATGIHHLCLSVEGFEFARALEVLAAHGVTQATQEAGGITGGALHARVRRRGPEYGGAPGGTPELYLGDPDGIVVQLQHTRYCGGAGVLGDVCQEPPAPAPGEGLLALQGINHFTVFVADPERSLAFYRQLFGLRVEKTQGSMPLLDVGNPDQILGFVGGPGIPGPSHIHHACLTIDDFQHERVLAALARHGITRRDDPEGRPIEPLSAYVTLRMPDRGGAPDGTPELYFTDPDGILIQIQDTRYCGGSGYLGEVCAYV